VIGSPGGHGRLAPAETIDDYVRNCRDGLEDFSQRRAAKVLGWSRIEVYRAILMAALPEDLFEALLSGDCTSTRELANIALALTRGHSTTEIERCPHCGRELRVRKGYSAKSAAIDHEPLGGTI
jgi:hypothetical protein